MLTVIIPASNEELWIGPCLSALCASSLQKAQVIVVANGCKDKTADLARQVFAEEAPESWDCTVLDFATGSKPFALNQGDAQAKYPIRAYLDADVIVSRGLLAALVTALSTDAPRYASGTPQIPPARSAVTRAYARFWQGLPFNRTTAPGYGLFAVNAAGRARWQDFPSIISDDTFVRLQFQPDERVQVNDTYLWPMIEGFAALTRVRRRQDAGVKELERLYPGLLEREGKPPLSKTRLLGMLLQDPVGFATYAAVSLAVRLKRGGPAFTRGR